MPTPMNRTKVLGELFLLTVLFNDFTLRKDYKRMSPATKQVVSMMRDTLEACQKAVREDHPLMFEINVWEQLSLTGWAIEKWSDEDPIQIE